MVTLKKEGSFNLKPPSFTKEGVGFNFYLPKTEPNFISIFKQLNGELRYKKVVSEDISLEEEIIFTSHSIKIIPNTLIRIPLGYYIDSIKNCGLETINKSSLIRLGLYHYPFLLENTYKGMIIIPFLVTKKIEIESFDPIIQVKIIERIREDIFIID